jgi:protein SCO1/2
MRIKAGPPWLPQNGGMSLRQFILLAATAAAFLVPRVIADEKVYAVIGAIRTPLDGEGRIVIAHEAIPELMPAMTMSFAVTDRAEAAVLKTGDRVRFQLRVNGDAWTTANFAVVGYEPPPATTTAAKATRHRLREGDAVPEFALTTQNNEPFATAQLRGHRTLMTFIFTRCPVPEFCPAMALRFAQIQNAILADPKLAGRVQLLGITLDPEFDRPGILKAYAEAVGAKPGVWQFATGEKSEIEALAKSFAVFTERNGATLDHTLCTALIGEDGRVLDLWRGNGWRVDEVLDALSGPVSVR